MTRHATTITAAVPSYGDEVSDEDKDDPDRTDVSQALYLSAPANSREASARGRRGGGGEEEGGNDTDYSELSEAEKQEVVAGALMEEIMDQTVGSLSKVKKEENESKKRKKV